MIHRWRTITILIATLSLGGGGLLAFGLFIFNGPPNWVRFNWSSGWALCWNGTLSLLFFIQHSSMLRRPVRKIMGRYLPEIYLDAAYGVVSGTLLLTLVVFWQPAPQVLVALSGWVWWLARACFFLSILGFMWTAKSLGNFDPLGAAALMDHLGKPSSARMPLTVSGPYRWVRHPFYFFSIVMIWSYPIVTHDRLLFNLLWTAWIWIGTRLEERDLVNDYGKAYQEYQRSVPMLLPLGLRKRK